MAAGYIGLFDSLIPIPTVTPKVVGYKFFSYERQAWYADLFSGYTDFAYAHVYTMEEVQANYSAGEYGWGNKDVGKWRAVYEQ